MESLLVGSFQRASSPLSIPYLAELTSLHGCSNVATRSFKRKAFRNAGQSYTMPLRLQLQRRTLMNVRSFGGRIVKSNSSQSLKYIVKSASEQPFESEPSKNPWNSPQHALDAFYRFSRPHTIIGTALSIISVSLLAVEKLSDFSPLFFSGVLEAIVAALLMNLYIVGLNQISDIDIDKVNKPYLPLASGEYSVTTGVMIVSSFAILSFWLGWMVSSWPLLWALFVSFVLGTAYSINKLKIARRSNGRWNSRLDGFGIHHNQVGECYSMIKVTNQASNGEFRVEKSSQTRPDEQNCPPKRAARRSSAPKVAPQRHKRGAPAPLPEFDTRVYTDPSTEASTGAVSNVGLCMF